MKGSLSLRKRREKGPELERRKTSHTISTRHRGFFGKRVVREGLSQGKKNTDGKLVKLYK